MNKSLMEKRIHGEADFPVSVYEGSFSAEEVVLAPLHFHPEMELLVARAGKLSVRINEGEYEVGEGEGIFINRAKLHAIYGEAGKEKSFVAVVFSERFLGNGGERVHDRYMGKFEMEQSMDCKPLTNEQVERVFVIADELQREEYGYEIYVKANLLFIMGDFVRRTMESPEKVLPYKYQGVKLVLRYIEEHFMEAVSLQEMADVAGLNKEYFCRVFSELAGETPFTYLNRFRIQKALEYLKHTDKSIQEISELCGYASASYFSHTFRKFEGVSPKKIKNSRDK